MPALPEVIGESPAIRAVKDQCARLVALRGETRRLPSVLLQGETGTGKGLVARALHRASPRRDAPFVDVNCAAIPETLLEAEMFGFERGAFTDARQAKPGLFQTAHRGTIFLDEVGLLPEALQAKLLKVIEERTVRRLGATRSEPVDVWILTGTNEDMLGAVRARRFREDLYHRLAVMTITLPPVRERGDDVIRLAEHFLARACSDYGFEAKTLSADARAALLAYRWPGNVRELANAIERAALLGEGSELTAAALGLSPASVSATEDAPTTPTTLEAAVSAVEHEQLLDALRATAGNVSRAAGRLGISRNTMRYRMEKYGLLRDGTGVGARPGRRVARAEPPTPKRATPPANTAARAAAPAGAPEDPPVPTAIRWERRRLTFLRAEVSGVTLEQPQSSRELELVVEKVQTFGGRVEEVGITSVLAVFGVEPTEDAPRRAVLAAMAMHNAITRDAAARLRVAVHVDQCLVARVHRTSTVDFDAKRQATRLLDDLLGGPPLEAPIVVTDAAVPFLERRFELVALDRPGGGRRLVGRERVGLAPAGRLAPFVGREREMDLLRRHFELAATGTGQVIGIVGDPGIGKSRLLFEFRQALPASVVHLEGRCLSHGIAIPYLPVLDVIRATCGIADADAPDVIASKVRGALAAQQIDVAQSAPYLLHLLDVKEGGVELDVGDPAVVRRRLFETIRQLWVLRSRRAPLVIVVEDLHWMDASSEACLASLVETLPRAAILLVVVYRPGYRPPWIDLSYVTQVALPPLAAPESRHLVRASVGDRIPDDVVDIILDKAEGNPFFLEELTRVVRDRPDAALAVPDTVEAVLLARIDRLSPEEKHVLQCAAVLGRRVPMALFRAIVANADERLRRNLAVLQTAEFLYATGGEEEYAFKHALTQEVAYGSLLTEERQALHARVVEVILEHAAGRIDEHIDELAHHAFEGGLYDQAVRYYRRAGGRAAARSAHREAVAYLERALKALEHVPQTGDALQAAIDLRFDLRNALLPLGDFGRILEHLLDAEALVETRGDRRSLARLFASMTNYVSLMGDQDRALQYGERALAIARALGDPALEVETNVRVGQIYHTLGDYRRAVDVLRPSLAFLEGDLIHDRFGLAVILSVLCGNWLVRSLAEIGEFGEALARGQDGLRVAEAVGQPIDVVVAAQGIGVLHLRRLEVEPAVSLLERAFELCQTSNIRVWYGAVASTLAWGYGLAGRGADAVKLLDEAAERERHPSPGRMGTHALRLAEGYLAAGRPAEASRFTAQTLELARTHRERGHEAWALRLVGELGESEGASGDEAAAHYRAALALADELGMRPLVARCHLSLGELQRRAGGVAATDHLRTSATLFRAMDMPRWAARSDAALGGSA